MTTIGFIGVGNMGGPMVKNLVDAGHQVAAFDLVEAALASAQANGASRAASVAEASGGREVVITMLPAGRHVVAVYGGEEGVIANAAVMINAFNFNDPNISYLPSSIARRELRPWSSTVKSAT